MCLAKVLMKSNDAEQLIMKDIALIKVEDNKITISSIFGEQKEIEATIKEINFLNSSIILEKS